MSIRVALLAFFIVLGCPAWALADTALTRAETALLRVPLRGDEAFLVGQGRQVRGLSPLFLRPSSDFFQQRSVFPYSIEFGLWNLRDRAIALPRPLFALPATPLAQPRKARALRDAGAGYQPLYVSQAGGAIRAFQAALECRPGTRAPAFGEAGYEYHSTHQAAAVLLAWRRGCMSEAGFRAVAPAYLARVRAEYLATRELGLNDLQVERMAVLCLAGFCGGLAESDVAALRRVQSPDGLWRFRDNIRELDEYPPHASALAYFVLSARAVK